ncbi:MAG: folate-binding protein YgfZ [Rhodospirillales bacterium]|nr:MAG: folate-binding protein YgfZ [Rhodospirillales bacterium]
MTMTQMGFCIVGHRGVVRVGGDDRVAFLQGLISNDVERVSSDRAVHAALLTPQGRFLWDMTVVARDDSFLLEVERDRAAALAKKLTIYKLRSKVTVADLGESMEVAVAFGPGAAGALGLPEEAGAARTLDDGVALVDPRLPALGVRVLAPQGHAAALLSAKGFAALPFDDYENLRIGLGVPDGSRDLPVEKALLLENGFDELNGVDWKKGCYMGQELTARTKYRALIKKRLLPVSVEGPLPAPGTPVTLDGQEAGEIRSGIGGHALALLRLDAVERARGAVEGLTAGGAKLRPVPPDWVRLPAAEG